MDNGDQFHEQSGLGPSNKRRKQPKRLFQASRSVLMISAPGRSEISADKVSSPEVGWKAYGLTVLPAGWTLPFFVVSESYFQGASDHNAFNRWVTECCSLLGIPAGAQLMIRSSGTVETLRHRGSLVSDSCSADSVLPTIEKLREQVSSASQHSVHWVVQQFVKPQFRGHLSNERRVSREPRDWNVEFEPVGGNPGYNTSFGVRTWRDGVRTGSAGLTCESGTEILDNLRQAAKWALQFSSRIHFEWIWAETRVWIVQADAAELDAGVNPTSAMPGTIPNCSIAGLQVFRLATAADYETYRKLQNARLYAKFGYAMPPFYVANDPALVAALQAGSLLPALEHDLGELLKRPLIVRTDGTNIPSKKREMLPRSDPLGSILDAKTWLLGKFRDEIQQAGLAASELGLIAHHFIPSVASAWARAEPGNRIVRIESLWGIPEGLYWYSHDTYEVDTQNVALAPVESHKNLPYTIIERMRHKGTFVATAQDGKWQPTQVLAPYEWRSSIRNKHWLVEIAHTTRHIAEIEQNAVAVMWFVENHKDATTHRVLPWYHDKSETPTPRAAPRRKISTINDFLIKSVSDWDALQQDLRDGKRIERVVVQPIDADLLRNKEFAEKLAILATEKKFVIELSGSILAHVYYVLTCGSARVECIDLFGTKEDVVEYNKIIRDKIPDQIAERGERAETIQLQGDAMVAALRQKLVEEAFEALDAEQGQDLVGELADIGEVVNGLCTALNVSLERLQLEISDKRRRKGGFEKGLMLRRTASPHSIRRDTPISERIDPDLVAETLISDAARLPRSPFYRRPDLRLVDLQPEKLLSFATQVNQLVRKDFSLSFSMPINGLEQEFKMTLELERAEATIRGKVRLRTVPGQMKMDFPDSRQLQIEFSSGDD